MATVTGNDYDHITISDGTNNTVHYLKDTAARDNLIKIQSTQPTETENKLWITGETTEVQVPTYDEFTDLKSALFDDTAIEGALLSSVYFYSGTMVSTSGWADGDKYSLRCYPIEADKTYILTTRPDFRYAFSNYEYHQNLGAEDLTTTTTGNAVINNTKKYKYMYVINTSPNYPSELPNVVELRENKLEELTAEDIAYTDVAYTAGSVGKAVKDNSDAVDSLTASVNQINTSIDQLNTSVFDESTLSHTLLSSVGLYQGTLVSTSSWPDGDKYSVKMFSIEAGKTYDISCRSGAWYAFSNYTYSQGLGMEHQTTAPSASFSIENTLNYKYLYMVNTSAVNPSENPIVITNKTDRLTAQKSKFIISKRRIIVAANNASASDKMIADYVCDGTNDEVEIQEALDSIISLTGGEVLLTVGDFYVDDFPTRGGKRIALSMAGTTADVFSKAVIGCGIRPANYSRTRIYVTATAMSALGDDEGVVFGCPSFVYGRTGIFKDFSLYLADNQHSVTVIDNTQYSAGSCEGLNVCAVMPEVANTESTPMPSTKCIGITGYCGDDAGTYNIMANCFVTGFYEGFRLGGEHLVCTQIGARFNYYAYTFGNYDWHIGTMSHPITLINCCDEHSAKLPKFVRSGNYDSDNQLAKMQVDMIGFNMELLRPANFGGGNVDGAEETVPGAYCGTIEFTAYGNANGGGTEQPITTNQKRVKFWADGSGTDFVTRNAVHKQAGTTSERQNYYPQYMQQYYDTDLKKLLIYDGSAWVDMNGTAVD